MSLQKAECTSCGSTLIVDNKLKAAICEYCGSAYIVEEAINKYYYNYNYNYNFTNNITADNVIVTGKGDAEKERLLKNAKTNEGLGEYGKAKQIYTLITDDYPGDYRGWLGLALLISKNNTKTDITKYEYDKVCDYMKKVFICVPSDKKDEIRRQWDDYKNKRSDNINRIKKELDDLINKEKHLTDLINIHMSKSEEYYKRLNGINKKGNDIKKLMIYFLD